MRSSFGSKELINCLLCLGFTKKRSTGSSHSKYSSPKKVAMGMRPFITVILNRKVFDPHTQSSYLLQIKKLGFSAEDIEKCFVR